MDNRCNSLSECDFLKELFDKVRIINPLKNEVVDLPHEGVTVSKSKCYSIWMRKSKCENCISIRAFNENKTFIKVEYKDTRIYSITATPINKNGDRYVVECIKDVTESMLINELESISIDEVYNKIEKLNKLVITDELTGCYNRRYLNERLPLEINESQENGEKLSIVVMDIDNFKYINDKYSHQVGDYVLKEIGKIIRNNIRREYDWVSRFGGEEFLISFKNIDNENAVCSTERIRQNIEAHKFTYNDLNINVTASFGVVELSDEINEMSDLIAAADKNLYKAKELGKNMIIK
ncbi:Stalked cell differentiation-controlling protein [uncultured Clostridium sp.]|uniref:GGDEF domain-containing protein n=1 Tax=uncultured Clostridium sp. TaxID=59620 RepID=UPI000821A13A|nr:GGDEF domain-containing protein [uncultured Clostridium sp.]SCI79396.1 Stalked cell differentiation-controlling protein [uncultured Clostridium sp.]